MKNKNPIVSIIVPVYNTEKYLERCIVSLRQQTLNSIEIILIDDGSSDNSGNICDDYASKDDRIKVIHKRNEGQGLARNSVWNYQKANMYYLLIQMTILKQIPVKN